VQAISCGLKEKERKKVVRKESTRAYSGARTREKGLKWTLQAWHLSLPLQKKRIGALASNLVQRQFKFQKPTKHAFQKFY
jgi:hypothetical protein